MRRHNIVGYLIQCLDRSNVDLLLVAMMFLKKLAIFQARAGGVVVARWQALLVARYE